MIIKDIKLRLAEVLKINIVKAKEIIQLRVENLELIKKLNGFSAENLRLIRRLKDLDEENTKLRALVIQLSNKPEVKPDIDTQNTYEQLTQIYG